MRKGVAIALGSVLFWAGRASAEEQPDLSNLSIEQLAQVKVTSVSKQAEPLSEAPASLYVIDHDQIVRSGALTIPEILRLAPNIQVYQSSPSHWIVTARGLNGLPSAQSFSNKLLVLIDGRTVYTPLFSGVYWDMPDLLPDDIERIEIISGPGATLWGANAVNGVINIITRSASSTSGFYLDVKGGTNEQVVGARLAGKAGSDLSYRAYLRWLHEDAFDLAGGGSANDAWHRLGGGFRLDWTPAARDLVTVQGDIFRGRDDEGIGALEDISGHDLVLRWNRDMGPGRQLQVQAFYDRSARDSFSQEGSFYVDTYDVDLQDSLPLGSRNQFVWGGGVRVAHYRINGTTNFFFVPDSRNLFLANLFVQDTFDLSRLVSLTAGLKAEHDPYVGTSLLPDLRLAITPAQSTLLWAAVSHAVRSATPFDEDVRESAPGITLTGDRNFQTEKLTAYELGLRLRPLSGLSFSATGFYHHYDDLRSVELGPGPGLNLFWGNELAGHSYGLEAWASARPFSWWTLSAGATLQKEQFHFKPGASAPFIGTTQNGTDPDHWLTLQSSMNLGRSVTLDLNLRAVGRLADSDVPAYAELGGRFAWNASDHLQLSLLGANLLHAQHVEYPGGDAIGRKILVGLEWRP
ncbi:MAG TPA: TonB-dependent receptor plug domain-containing protein [Sphingomicrobium sp.]|nr:TonB-dependent receptor plug domain-containing protein [Sphingomicrobium sp.]